MLFRSCLPLLSLLSAERIGRVFVKQGQLYGQGTIYSTAIMAWSFLDPMLREEQAAAYPLAMAQRVVHQTEAGGAVTNFGHGPQLSRARDSLLLGAVLVRIGSRHQRQRPATNVRGVVVKLEPKHLQTAEGGTRTHTRGEPNWILNPARLPVPPLRPLKAGGIMGWTRRSVKPVRVVEHVRSHSNIVCCQFGSECGTGRRDSSGFRAGDRGNPPSVLGNNFTNYCNPLKLAAGHGQLHLYY